MNSILEDIHFNRLEKVTQSMLAKLDSVSLLVAKHMLWEKTRHPAFASFGNHIHEYTYDDIHEYKSCPRFYAEKLFLLKAHESGAEFIAPCKTSEYITPYFKSMAMIMKRKDARFAKPDPQFSQIENTRMRYIESIIDMKPIEESMTIAFDHYDQINLPKHLYDLRFRLYEFVYTYFFFMDHFSINCDENRARATILYARFIYEVDMSSKSEWADVYTKGFHAAMINIVSPEMQYAHLRSLLEIHILDWNASTVKSHFDLLDILKLFEKLDFDDSREFVSENMKYMGILKRFESGFAGTVLWIIGKTGMLELNNIFYDEVQSYISATFTLDLFKR